jgi:hypothetical protein
MSGLTWTTVEDEIRPTLESGAEVVWAPLPGSQSAFLECPIYEVLYEGPRGNGKTDALLFDFARDVGAGWGAEWRGILFRQTFKQLTDVIAKTKKWFPRIWPAAVFNESRMTWTWPTGETLQLSYFEREDDYWNYHGHAYPWIGWEELTTWADDSCYRRMMACSRSTVRRMPRRYRSTTNPYGIGHNWVKARFELPVLPGRVVGKLVVENAIERIAIHGTLEENVVLMRGDPTYTAKVSAAARNESERKAWLDGSWDIVAGGMFDDVWAPRLHIVPDVPLDKLPAGWRLNRSYDHGQSKPFSVGWWAQSNGEPLEVAGRKLGAVRGDLLRVAEWYGWRGVPNEGIRLLSTEIGEGIARRERDWGLVGRVAPGPADSSIFDDFEPGRSVAGDMQARGVRWTPADKGPGSRKHGWEQVRKALAGAVPGPEGVRETPGLFVCRRCEQFIRTIPVLPRDNRDLDDVDTDAEDHVADEVRYRLREKVHLVTTRSW